MLRPGENSFAPKESAFLSLGLPTSVLVTLLWRILMCVKGVSMAKRSQGLITGMFTEIRRFPIERE